jgi:hypothetical protein
MSSGHIHTAYSQADVKDTGRPSRAAAAHKNSLWKLTAEIAGKKWLKSYYLLYLSFNFSLYKIQTSANFNITLSEVWALFSATYWMTSWSVTINTIYRLQVISTRITYRPSKQGHFFVKVVFTRVYQAQRWENNQSPFPTDPRTSTFRCWLCFCL